jgi:predicted ester cyclase
VSATTPDDIDAPRRPPGAGAEPEERFRHYFDGLEQALDSHVGQWREKAEQLRAWGRTWVLDGWMKLDQQALLSVVTDDFVCEDPALMGTECRGRDAYRKFLADTLTAFPDTGFDTADPPFLGLDGTQLILPWHATGHFTGPLRIPGTNRTLAPTGRPFSMPGIDLYTFRGEQICGLRSIYDGVTVAQQIGLFPPSDNFAFRRVAPIVQPLLAPLMRRGIL